MFTWHEILPLQISFLQSQNNLAKDKVLNKTGLMLGSVKRWLLQLSGWKSNCSPSAPVTYCVLNRSARAITCLPFARVQRALQGVHQGEFHSAENGDVKADSWNVTVAPLTTPMQERNTDSRGRCPKDTKEVHIYYFFHSSLT